MPVADPSISASAENVALRHQLAIYQRTVKRPSIRPEDRILGPGCGTDPANILFHVVNDRHKRKRSMIFTTNKPLAAWGRVLHDEDLAHACVDSGLER